MLYRHERAQLFEDFDISSTSGRTESRRPVTATGYGVSMHGGRDVANDASTVFDLVILGGGSGEGEEAK